MHMPLIVALLAATFSAADQPSACKTKFRMHTINAESRYEAASAFDVNKDGKLDIFCGGFWYEAPHWKKHFVRDIKEQDNYYHDFAACPLDVDGDGWTDVISCTWHTKEVLWIRNPGRNGHPWTVETIGTPGHMETAMLADLNGDTQPDVLPNVFDENPAWYSFKRDPQAPDGATWTTHTLPRELAGPGVGAGDINQDGRIDIIGCKGWAEAPVDPAAKDAPWKWHAEFDLVDPGIPVLVHDIDRDGDADLIYGIGHNYGLYWLEQERDATGKRTWSLHLIDNSFSQAHVTLLGDLDGDGEQELFTGKRYHAHNGHDPGGNEPKVIYWYDFDLKKRQWTRHVIQEDGPAGAGIFSQLVDLDSDGDLDILAPGKSGLYLFENLRKCK